MAQTCQESDVIDILVAHHSTVATPDNSVHLAHAGDHGHFDEPVPVVKISHSHALETLTLTTPMFTAGLRIVLHNIQSSSAFRIDCTQLCDTGARFPLAEK